MMPPRRHLDVVLKFEAGCRDCGLVLCGSDDMGTGDYIRLETGRQRLVFDRWSRPGDLPFDPGPERPLSMEPGRPVRLQGFVEDSVCEVYADTRIAMSVRLYDFPEG